MSLDGPQRQRPQAIFQFANATSIVKTQNSVRQRVGGSVPDARLEPKGFNEGDRSDIAASRKLYSYLRCPVLEVSPARRTRLVEDAT